MTKIKTTKNRLQIKPRNHMWIRSNLRHLKKRLAEVAVNFQVTSRTVVYEVGCG